MPPNKFAKFEVGDLVYKHPSTKQKEGDAGVAVRVIIGRKGDEPHVQYELPDGSKSGLFDCSRYGYGGQPSQSVRNTTAIVKWLEDAHTRKPPTVNPHMEWPVVKVTNVWALAEDPWFNRLHWLKRDSIYQLWVEGHLKFNIVTMQALEIGK